MQPLSPIHYTLAIEPDLTLFSFAGRVQLVATLQAPCREIYLHALDLEVETCSVSTGQEHHPCLYRQEGDERLVILLPGEIVGNLTLDLSYRGTINDQMAGFYRSGSGSGAASTWIALTQFQERDARRAFPCVDTPAAKATFDITLVVDQHHLALSNGRIRQESPLAHGKKRVCFERTPRMSTYLVFFAVGPFTAAADEVDPRIRAVTLPGMLAMADLGMEFGRAALDQCERYFRIPYPLPKMDLIAVPDFAFGAMENWGAITFRENLLLRFPGVTSRRGEEQICEVIAHEVAHQWFGNLVTPARWIYLWLNESFATYFGFHVVDGDRPQWQVWQQFLASQTESALARDELRTTFPIELPGSDHVVIDECTAPIIYSKGASILRQIEGYVGPEAFRDGLCSYLQRHAYGVAASHHLWEALEQAAHKPVTQVMQGWVEQPGHPLLQVTRQADRLVVSQRPFTYLQRDAAERWAVPLHVRTFCRQGPDRDLEFLLTADREEFPLPRGTECYQVNSGQTGFYRVQYLDPAHYAQLGQRVRDATLPAEDRWGLQNDLFALVLAGAEPLSRYLEFLEFYDREDAFLPLGSIARNLRLAHRVLGQPAANRVAATGRRLLETALGRIGFTPRNGEAHNAALLREQILYDAAVFGGEDARREGLAIYRQIRAGDAIAPDLIQAALQIAAAYGSADTLGWLQQRLTTTGSEHERINLLSAMGACREPERLREALTFAVDEVPPRIRFVPIVAAAANPGTADPLWQWFEDHLPSLETLHPMLFERILVALLPAAGIAAPQAVTAFAERYAAQHPALGEVLRLALETLQVYLGFRQREAREDPTG